DQIVSRGDVEVAVATLDQFRLDTELLPDGGRQTGGPGKVVSNDAVFDRHLHEYLLVVTGQPSRFNSCVSEPR
ncbi:MAG TPA: hypothetical protein VMS12_12030, partial [Thermoanaerobaculia bacterium]|nr:hypothetical protein [Thermoanaerobaculia bacterium]